MKNNCHICGFSTGENDLLYRHLAIVHKEMSFKCELCDYAGGRKFQLKNHVKACHLNTFRYKCDECDYSSNNTTNVQRHVKSVHRYGSNRGFWGNK